MYIWIHSSVHSYEWLKMSAICWRLILNVNFAPFSMESSSLFLCVPLLMCHGGDALTIIWKIFLPLLSVSPSTLLIGVHIEYQQAVLYWCALRWMHSLVLSSPLPASLHNEPHSLTLCCYERSCAEHRFSHRRSIPGLHPFWQHHLPSPRLRHPRPHFSVTAISPCTTDVVLLIHQQRNNIVDSHVRLPPRYHHQTHWICLLRQMTPERVTQTKTRWLSSSGLVVESVWQLFKTSSLDGVAISWQHAETWMMLVH